jgi:hypothetical protein
VLAEILTDALQKVDSFSLTGFGTFEVRECGERIGPSRMRRYVKLLSRLGTPPRVDTGPFSGPVKPQPMDLFATERVRSFDT